MSTTLASFGLDKLLRGERLAARSGTVGQYRCGGTAFN